MGKPMFVSNMSLYPLVQCYRIKDFLRRINRVVRPLNINFLFPHLRIRLFFPLYENKFNNIILHTYKGKCGHFLYELKFNSITSSRKCFNELTKIYNVVPTNLLNLTKIGNS